MITDRPRTIMIGQKLRLMRRSIDVIEIIREQNMSVGTRIKVITIRPLSTLRTGAGSR